MHKEKTRKEKKNFKGFCPFKLPRHEVVRYGFITCLSLPFSDRLAM